LDTFDWYSPKYQSKHTYEQVFRWFESCGLRDLGIGEIAIGVKGRKPPMGETAQLKTVEVNQVSVGKG
jgi:hypothetical protein